MKITTPPHGELIIQATNSHNPILKQLENSNLDLFFDKELQERKAFQYPPYVRLIMLRLSFRNRVHLHNVALELDQTLQQCFDSKNSPPYEPLIDKIQGEYQLEIILRFNRDNTLIDNKKRLAEVVTKFRQKQPLIKLIVDVDPL